MKQYQGQLNRTFIKVWKGISLHSFTLAGVDGFFKTGRTPAPVKEGSFVEFEADDKNQVEPASIKVVPAPEAPIKAPELPPSTSAPATPSYWENRQKGDMDRQKAITYQAARKDAISVAELCASATGGDLEVVLGLIDDLTMRFAEDTERLRPEVPGFRPKKTKAGKAKATEAPTDKQQELNLG